jgi:hypothetical protein
MRSHPLCRSFAPRLETLEARDCPTVNIDLTSVFGYAQSLENGIARDNTAQVSRIVLDNVPIYTTTGLNYLIAVEALDSAGHLAANYTGNVHFSSTDTRAGLPGDYTFTAGDRGVHNFAVTMNTPGTFTLQAADLARGLSDTHSMTVIDGTNSRYDTFAGGGNVILYEAILIMHAEGY